MFWTYLDLRSRLSSITVSVWTFYYNGSYNDCIAYYIIIVMYLRHWQWKINKVEDLNNTAKADIWWDNWEGFKTSFKWNWSEVDSPGSAMNSIYALTEKAKKNKISMESYISLFKEYVRKAGIVTDEAQPNNAAVSLFCQGLPYKVLDKAMNQNPTNLGGWYTSIQPVINAWRLRSCINLS